MRRCFGRRVLFRRLGPSAIVTIGAAMAFAGAVIAQDAPAAPVLERGTVPAVGTHAVDVEISTFGRYAIFAESERGSAVQVVDRAAGPGGIVGVTGEQDGRVDTFLDRGDVRVLVHGLAESQATDGGEVRVRVEPFREVGADAVRLTDLASVETTLGDLETRAWWIELKTARRVTLEAAGRHLNDLRIWRDGTWLVGIEPVVDLVEPAEGRPLTRCRISARLDPGLYKLTAYGGVGVPWANDDATGESARPLVLRSGLPTLGEAGRQRVEISAFGEDSFLVPGTATFFRLETGSDGPAGDAVELQVDDYVEESPFSGRAAQTVAIVKETNPPVVELDRGLDVGQLRRVTVRGRAGEAVVVQYFLSRPVYNFSESGRYWLSTISSGAPGDEIDATAILVRNRRNENPRQAMQVRAVDLVDGLEWRRRVNLLGTTTLHLQVVDAGEYQIQTRGEAKVGLRLEPFALPGTRPSSYRPPEFRDDSGEWQLDPGVYELTLEPRRPGIGEVWIRDPDPPSDLPAKPAPPIQADVRFGTLDLDRNDSYTLFLNQRPGVRTGIVLRRSPLDLHEPLPLALDSSESVSVRAAAGDGELVVRAEDGRQTVLGPVDGTVRVRLPEGVDGPAVVSVERIRPAWRGLLPTLPEGRLEALPDLPVLVAGSPARLDLAARRRATFRVRAETPGLYRLESTGLLDTRGIVRTRTIPVLEAVDSGGTGRNFSVGRYLAPGDYQLSVETQGSSAGRLGVQLARTDVRDAGRLTDGVPARGWLDAGEALAYTFDVVEAGRYRLRSLGLGEPFRVRLEDADGWPLVTPGIEGDLFLELAPGSYRWIVLPRSLRARQLTVIERLPEPVEREGHGPHSLTLGQLTEHRWREPANVDGERAPDVWTFTLSAPADVTTFLSQEMRADLIRLGAAGGAEGGAAQPIAELAPRRGFSGRLDAGEYALHVRAVRRDDHRDYEVQVSVAELLPGATRTVGTSERVTLSVGEAGLYELTTFGALDVRASLVDADGRLLAQADDRPGDWNIRLARRLTAGRYAVRMEAVGAEGETRLGLRRLHEVPMAPVELSAGEAVERTVSLDDGAAVLPLTLPANADALLVGTTSTEHVRLVAEVDGTAAGARDGRSATLLVPLDASVESMALRVEPLDDTGQPVQLRVVALDLDPRPEARAERLRSRPPAGFEVTPVLVELDRAGCFRVDGADVSTRPGRAAEAVSAAISAPRRVWLAVGAAGASLKRATVPDDGTLRLVMPAGDTAACDLGPLPPATETDGLIGKRLVVARGLGAPAAVAPSRGDAAGWWTNVDDSDVGGTPWFAARGVAGEASSFFDTASAAVVRVDAEGVSGPIEVDLWARSQTEIDTRTLGYGSSTLDVAPAAAKLVELPEDRSLRLTLDLSRGAMAVFGDRTVWAADRALRVRLDTHGGFFLVDTTDGGAQASIEVLPAPERGLLAPTLGQPFEWRATTGGTLDLPATWLHGSTLTLGVDALSIAGRDGSLGRGDAAADHGRLIVEHGAGPVVVWPYDPHDPLARFWPAERPAAERLALPSSIPLDGGGRVFEIEAPTPRVLHLRAPTTALVGIERPGMASSLDGSLDAVSLDLHLPAGLSRIALRPIAGGALAGPLDAWTEALVSLGEGLGPEALLGPGAARTFTIRVPDGAPRKIGFGVAADADIVEGRVVDAAGRTLGRGVLQWHDLEPGRYLFVLESPPDAPPVRVRPAIVGLDRPGTGPPAEVVEDYLRRAMADGARR